MVAGNRGCLTYELKKKKIQKTRPATQSEERGAGLQKSVWALLLPVAVGV